MTYLFNLSGRWPHTAINGAKRLCREAFYRESSIEAQWKAMLEAEQQSKPAVRYGPPVQQQLSQEAYHEAVRKIHIANRRRLLIDYVKAGWMSKKHAVQSINRILREKSAPRDNHTPS